MIKGFSLANFDTWSPKSKAPSNGVFPSVPGSVNLNNPIVQNMIRVYDCILKQTLEQGEKVAQPIPVRGYR